MEKESRKAVHAELFTATGLLLGGLGDSINVWACRQKFSHPPRLRSWMRRFAVRSPFSTVDRTRRTHSLCENPDVVGSDPCYS